MDAITKVGIPLDSEGFLRRECPKCESEFKIQTLESDHGDDLNDEGESETTCPYCAHRSDSQQWWTKPHAKILQEEMKRMAFDVLQGALGNIKSSKHLQVTKGRNPVPKRNMQPEPDDMKRVAVTCCERDVKVLEQWDQAVHCAECGKICS